MDAAAYLALLSKAKRVFESENTFLSFPVLSQLTYDVEELRFTGDAPAAQRLVNLSEFSRVTNRIQRGVVAAIDGDEYLWDVYDDVLSNAELAEPTLTEAQEKEYAAALKLLYTEAAEGLRRESPALEQYKTFRDAHIKALEEYKNRQLTADMSADPAVKAQWVIDEAAIRKTIDEIEASWKAAGRRAEIESAQQVERACNETAPALRWDEWRASFVADLDLATDTNQIRFAATMFSPHDVFDTEDWLRFTLSSDEIVALGTQAPQELREILGQVDTTSDIQSLSFEYRSVALDRAWLQRSVFDSRFWRLGPEGGELCDGGDPPKGRCPGYPVALVFARRVTLQWKGVPPADDHGVDPGRLLRLRPDILKQLRIPRPAVGTPRPVAATVARPRLELVGRQRRSIPISSSPALRLRFANLKTQRRSIQPDSEPRPVVTEEPTLPPSSTGDDIIILGLLCKRLPRCPDPDPALRWD